jgi:dTDP-4-amino-4,6-dideoxygalactose transaminase
MNLIDSSLISLSDPTLNQGEKDAISAVIDSRWLTMGDRVADFEKAFARLHGVDEAVAVDSCTAGLHLCLAAAGVGPEDEVLVPALTFVATVSSVLYVGAKPVFVDIEGIDAPHISIEDAEDKCTSRTKAVMVMHYGGYLVDLPAWRKFADRKGLVLIEDAAHAPGVGEVGRWGDSSAFSFFTNKNMTTCEGGMIFARDSGVLERIRRMRSHGMTMGTLDRHRGHAYSYDVTMLGYNYRMDEIRAAMGMAQLSGLPAWNARRKQLSRHYRRLIERRPEGFSVPFSGLHETAAHLMPVLLPEDVDRELVMKRMREAGIQTSIHYPPVHRFSYYLERFPHVSLPETERYCAREITLPLHPGLLESDVERVVESFVSSTADARR